MKVSKHEIILKIIDLNSLAKTADYYCYTPSAISQILTNYEEDLGFKLFTRTNKGLYPTSEGQQILPFIKEILKKEKLLEDKVNSLNNLYEGTIRIGALESIANHLLPKYIKQFKTIHPNIKFFIRCGIPDKLENWLIEGKLDLCFTCLPTAKTLQSEVLLKDPMLVVLPTAHPLKTASHFPMDKIVENDFILLEASNVREITDMFKYFNVKPKIEYRVREDFNILAFVENELGISILPKLITTNTNYKVICKPTNPQFYRTLGITYKDKSQLARAAKEFINLVTQHISKDMRYHDE